MSSPNSVSHEIAATLRNEILRGQYRVGERLPSERDLSVRFNVSRGAVREALSQLEQQGITETQPGGVRIKPLQEATLSILGPLMSLNPIPDPDLVDQFLEVFSALTQLTVKNAIDHASVEQLLVIEQYLAHLREVSSQSFEAMQPHWQAMLEYMASIDDNLVAKLIGKDIKAQFIGRMLELDIKPEIECQAGQKLVEKLAVAMTNKDGKSAAQAFEDHFNVIRNGVRKALVALQQGKTQAADLQRTGT